MKKISLQIIIFFILSHQIFSQKTADSIVFLGDLKYHSSFEKEALTNFVKLSKDTFNLILAIDENMTHEIANVYNRKYQDVFNELLQPDIQKKNINKKIKIYYSTIHKKFLSKYSNNESFNSIFESGTYNCVTASILYGMIFNRLSIPYNIMASYDHVYLIANPGPNSVVIETTNPNFEQTIFSGEYKQNYVNYLRSSKMISEEEYKSKSVEEIFQSKFSDVKSVNFNSLIGIQYYNKALKKIENHEITEALELAQKAYFFYPQEQVNILFYNVLLLEIQKSSFNKVSDIDYLAQLARFDFTDPNLVSGVFKNITSHMLEFSGKESYCDSLYNRLIPELSSKSLKDEIIFNYNMQMSHYFRDNEKVEKYIAHALEIKSNYIDAQWTMEFCIDKKVRRISDYKTLNDSINQFEKRYPSEGMKPFVNEFRLIAFLKTANKAFENKNIQEGEGFLQKFEETCNYPDDIEDRHLLKNWIENAYRSAAVYYFYNGDKTKAKKYIERGLKYVPESNYLESAVY